jgi:DnaJ-class molecular chaperone
MVGKVELEKCPSCKGTGKKPSDSTITESCYRCKGTGKVWV